MKSKYVVKSTNTAISDKSNLPVRIAHKDHLSEQLSRGIPLWYNLPEHKQQFLNGVILFRQNVSDYMHQQTRHLLSSLHHYDRVLEGLDLHSRGT